MSTHEEADFILMVRGKHAIDSNSPVIIRLHSENTEIFIMALTTFYFGAKSGISKPCKLFSLVAQ